MKFILILLAASFCFAQPVTIPLTKAPKYPAKKKKFDSPVVLDGRPAFKYAMNHLLTAQPIRWEDYSQTDEPHKGALDPDVGLLARKLRVYGIKPGREVIVLGEGAQGSGEEGRIGWMLLYLGLTKVKVLNVDSMKGKSMSGERLDFDEAPIWLPKINEKIKIEKRELTQIVKDKSPGVVIIDVRTAEEFKKQVPIPGAVNIPWTAFINLDGNHINADNFVRTLKEHHVDPTKELIFYDTNGVRSGYVTFGALQAHLNARNYDGSLMQWVGN